MKSGEKKELLINTSRAKEFMKQNGKYNVAGDCIDALNKHLHWLISQGQKRAEANGRKTVRGYDILIKE